MTRDPAYQKKTGTEKMADEDLKLRVAALAEVELDSPRQAKAVWKELVRMCLKAAGKGSLDGLRIVEGLAKTSGVLKDLMKALEEDLDGKVEALMDKSEKIALEAEGMRRALDDEREKRQAAETRVVELTRKLSER